jgi:serine/threonine protein phosphatase PrpC
MAGDQRLRCPNPDCREPVSPEDRYCEACGGLVPAYTSRRGGSAQPAAAGRGEGGSLPPADQARDRVEIDLSGLAGISDRGLRRERNEDAVALAAIEALGARALVVCDGVSVSAEPALASRAAADAALASLVAAVEEGQPDSARAMRQAVAAAQLAVCAVPYRLDGREGPPATTLVAALIWEGKATIGWIGDSRAYFVGDGEAWQLSHDDTWLEEANATEVPGTGGSALALRTHVLTRWLGCDQEGAPEPSVTTFLLPAEGCLLLCSDGLWNYAPTPGSMRELVARFSARAAPLPLARALVEFARSLGGVDNVTVAVATV